MLKIKVSVRLFLLQSFGERGGGGAARLAVGGHGFVDNLRLAQFLAVPFKCGSGRGFVKQPVKGAPAGVRQFLHQALFGFGQHMGAGGADSSDKVLVGGDFGRVQQGQQYFVGNGGQFQFQKQQGQGQLGSALTHLLKERAARRIAGVGGEQQSDA